MSKNICPCCKGKAEYLDIEAEYSEYLCVGCEIKMYDELHAVMDKLNMNKEQAYCYLMESVGAAGGKRWTGVRRPEVDLYPAQLKLRFEVCEENRTEI